VIPLHHPPEICNHTCDSRSRHSAWAEAKVVPPLLLSTPFHSGVILLYFGSLHFRSTHPWHYCNYRQNDWAEWLSIAEFSYNNQIYSSTGQSPFVVNLGCHPNTGKNINLSTKNSPGTEQFLKTIKEIRDKVESALKKTNEMMKRKWDLKRKPVEWSSGDLVWVHAVRGPLTHDPGAPPVASQHNFIVQPLVTKK